MSSRDPQGYYAALGIGPDASAVEISLAYRFLKDSYQKDRKQLDIGKIREAYDTLGDAAKRRAYDQGGAPRSKSARRPQIGFFQILVGALAIALLVLGILLGPELKAHLTNFAPGDELVWSKTGKPVGTVVVYEAAHSFREGVTGPAYQLLPTGNKPPEWYPAGDLKRHCSKR